MNDVKLSEAYETLALCLGTTVDMLPTEDKQIALLNATLEAGKDMEKSMSGYIPEGTGCIIVMQMAAAIMLVFAAGIFVGWLIWN